MIFYLVSSVEFYILTVDLLLCYHQALALPGAEGSLAAEYTLKVRLRRSYKGLSYLSLVDLSMQVMKSHIRHTATPMQGDTCRCAQKWQVINQTHGYGLICMFHSLLVCRCLGLMYAQTRSLVTKCGGEFLVVRGNESRQVDKSKHISCCPNKFKELCKRNMFLHD